MRGVTQVAGRPNPEKPLEELTHQDIMQLTREDCRRYLKEKGMRRPSWNKSQAIQQVLSLKNLFDSTPDDDTSLLREASHPQRLPKFVQAASNHNEGRKLEWLTEAELPVFANPAAISAKNVTTTGSHSAQLTIFYCGNVNVYNDVPADKAKAIMLLAGEGEGEGEAEAEAVTPNHLASKRCSVSASKGGRSGCIPFPATVQTSPQINLQKEAPISRKASLQRFLEKKKDRSRCKRSGGASKKPPMLMGMFMHPSYWSDALKKNPPKSSANANCRPSPTPHPQTPSSDEQALFFCRRKSATENSK